MTLLPDGKISTSPQPKQVLPFFRLAFRPMFWLGALFSVLSIGLWGLTYSGYVQFTPFGGGFFWHAHEMLFGFAVAIISGFLLTAVQTWTGVASVKGVALAVLVGLWLLARIVMAFPTSMPATMVMLIDLSFLPLAAFLLAIPIVKARLWRNLFFVPLLLLMTVLNGCMHLAVQGVISVSFLTISHTMVLLVTLVMCLMAGRVFPMFTASGTKTERVAPIIWLEKLSIASVMASVVVVSELIPLPAAVAAGVFIVAAVANFTRALRWRIWVTLKTPLVWPLHLSYWAICIGLLMLGLEKLGLLASASSAYHAITVGGIGLMILAMTSRVSLGHSGRMLQVGKLMTLAFSLLVFTFIARVIAPLYFTSYIPLILLSSALWVLAYSAFVIVYFPILFKSRIDGKDG